MKKDDLFYFYLVIYLFFGLEHCCLFTVLFSGEKVFLKLSIIYNNLVDYIFVNNNETFVFFCPPVWSLQGSETLGEYSYFHAEV